MKFIQRTFIKWLMPQISSQMRSPESGFGGTIAMKIMKRFNERSIREATRRLKLKNSDTYVEIGAGNGDGLKTILDLNKQTSMQMPKRVVLIEISERFRNELHNIMRQHHVDYTSRIEIRSEDCISMPYLSDDSVDTIFGMNVVYFLHPIETYLAEIKRVLKPSGRVIFGCKFGSVPKEGLTKEFVNVDRKKICNYLESEGFVVSMNKVVVDPDNEMSNYVEIVV
eukprot:scaffold109491_cov81-Cyclotella_meneghiniana.AAC.2